MLYKNIKKLVEYGVQTGLTPECERTYTTNLLLEIFKEDDYEDVSIEGEELDLEQILKELLDEAVARGLVEDSVVYRDLFDTKLMNCLMPRPAQVIRRHSGKNMRNPRRRPQIIITNSARTPTTSAVTASRRI